LPGCTIDTLESSFRKRQRWHVTCGEIMTGIGPVAVRCPRVRDRVGEGSERIRFSSAIYRPTHAGRKPQSADPDLYLKGISTGDFGKALIALLGKDAGGLSASTIALLKEAWSDEHARWGAARRNKSAKAVCKIEPHRSGAQVANE
jgi:hypothetical protein